MKYWSLAALSILASCEVVLFNPSDMTGEHREDSRLTNQCYQSKNCAFKTEYFNSLACECF